MSIIDDDITEGPEVFFMLAVSSNDRVQITPDRANVTIIDEDGKVTYIISLPCRIALPIFVMHYTHVYYAI